MENCISFSINSSFDKSSSCLKETERLYLLYYHYYTFLRLRQVLSQSESHLCSSEMQLLTSYYILKIY